MGKVGFAVFFVVAVLGAVLLLISQVPLTREYYELVDTRSFSFNEPMTFYSTFEANAKYRFEVKGIEWTSTSRYVRYLWVGNDTYLGALSDGPTGPTATPWVWYWNQNQEVTCTYNVTLYHNEYTNLVTSFQVIDRATTSASVEISQFRKTTYRLTYLLYLGLPLLIVGAILITITGKDVDSRTRMPDTSARRIPSLSFPNTQVRRGISVSFFRERCCGGWLVGTGEGLLRFYQILADIWIRRMEHWILYGDGNGVVSFSFTSERKRALLAK